MKKWIAAAGIFSVLLIVLASCSSRISERIVGNAEYISIYSDLSYDRGIRLKAEELKKYNPEVINVHDLVYSEDDVMWKGDRFGVLRLKDGTGQRIKVSWYGNFFEVKGHKGYYTYKTK